MKAVDALNTADAQICQNAWSTPRVSAQRSVGASDPDDSAHQGAWECHSGPQPVMAAMRMAHCAASSSAVRIGPAHMPETSHDKPHEASWHGAKSEGDCDCSRT